MKNKKERQYVTKTDIVNYTRCPHRVYLAHALGTSALEFTTSKLIPQLITEGIKFEESILDSLPLTPESLVSELLAVTDKDILWHGTEILENKDYQIRGRVDLVRTTNGILYPIEIKNHATVEETDRLELGFYWLLLDTYRAHINGVSPTGFIILNTGKLEEIKLNEGILFKVVSLIVRTRSAFNYDTSPAISNECKHCTEEKACLEFAGTQGLPSLVWGIAGTRQAHLANGGIHTLAELASANIDDIANLPSIGYKTAKKLQIGATAHLERKPILFDNEPFPVLSKIVILDLEYTPSEIFTIGLLRADGTDKTIRQWFISSKQEKKEALKEFRKFLHKDKDYTLITYAGSHAELVVMPKILSAIPNHFDPYEWLMNNMRLPTKSLGLKAVSDFFGFESRAKIKDGQEAFYYFEQYEGMLDEVEKGEIKNNLLEYNKEDLERALLIIQAIQKGVTNMDKNWIHHENKQIPAKQKQIPASSHLLDLEQFACPKCGVKSQLNRNGHRLSGRHKLQMFQCRACQAQFSERQIKAEEIKTEPETVEAVKTFPTNSKPTPQGRPKYKESYRGYPINQLDKDEWEIRFYTDDLQEARALIDDMIAADLLS